MRGNCLRRCCGGYVSFGIRETSVDSVTGEKWYMKLNSLDHFNISTSCPQDTIHFYCEILGMEDGASLRPPSQSPGTWLLLNGQPALHINFVSESPGDVTGPVDHLAFDASGVERFEQRLNDHGIHYNKVERPAVGLIQLFLRDPNGIKLELNIRGEI